VKRQLVGAQPPFGLIEVAGTRVAVKDRGAGMPVLCLHATGHGGRDFDPFADLVVPQGFRVVTLDWPGQGSSPPDEAGKPASGARYGEIAAAIVPLMFPDGAPIVIGSSVGGIAALWLARHHPASARALVLCNAGGLAPMDPLGRRVVAAMVGFFAAGERGARWFPAAFALYYRLVLPKAPEQRRRIVDAAPETARVIKEAWQSFADPAGDMRATLASLDLPVLFAWAKSDRIVSWSRSRAAIEAYRNGAVRHFRGGHAAFLEDPRVFADAFVAFAARL
jgi:4,5:9,10-diseco-3-hydroxy-5,9,17-trioxoandrosta-1(10),2-diene-4-oate hydrolase